MNLEPFVEGMREQLLLAAENSGEDSRLAAERMTATMDAALRLTLLEALSAAADEITLEITPGAVELRLRGRDPEFVVSLPTHNAPSPPPAPPEVDDSGNARITLRLSESLKQRIEQAASRDGQSVNGWLVRTLTAATETPRPAQRSMPTGGQNFTGWVH